MEVWSMFYRFIVR
uniref:Uncharacterized protein n=1 Tax=Arundo donax TaxID=35708 RepID=A0A0A9DUL5_ARUDO